VLVRVNPDVRGETHEKISTGQADSKFRLSTEQVGEAIARVDAAAACPCTACTPHRLAAARARPFRRACAELVALGDFPVLDMARARRPVSRGPAPDPEIEDYIAAIATARGIAAAACWSSRAVR